MNRTIDEIRDNLELLRDCDRFTEEDFGEYGVDVEFTKRANYAADIAVYQYGEFIGIAVSVPLDEVGDLLLDIASGEARVKDEEIRRYDKVGTPLYWIADDVEEEYEDIIDRKTNFDMER